MHDSITVIYEDMNFVVIAKPPGISVHSGTGISGATVADWIRKHYPETVNVGDNPSVRPGIVHRLDKDTSGIMVVARTQPAFEALKTIFKNRELEKTYLALVAGTPKTTAGIVDAPIGRSIRNRTKRAVGMSAVGARPAKTRWRVLEYFPLGRGMPGFALIEAKPETGRMHQIRVHLASIGLPIAGDRIYGGGKPRPAGLARQFLHAWRISFTYPEGRRWQFEAALPEDLERVLSNLRVLQRQR